MDFEYFCGHEMVVLYRDCFDDACDVAIDIFGKNAKQLLLASPIKGKTIEEKTTSQYSENEIIDALNEKSDETYEYYVEDGNRFDENDEDYKWGSDYIGIW